MIDRVIKFGSSTLTSEEGRSNINAIIESHLNSGERICVVISSQDSEGQSAELISELKRAIPSSEYCEPNALIEVNQKLGNEAVDRPKSFEKIKSVFASSESPCIITTGFLGEDESKSLSVRPGSSDYTATIIAAALKAREVDLYTVVDGIMTANPSKVPSAFSIPHLSYEEATELCHFGARIIYPLAIQPAFEHKIPIRIKNCLNPCFEGTLISEEICPSKFTVTGVTSIPEVSLLRLEGSGMYGVAGIAKRLFAALSEERINVILISQASSESSICAAIPPEKAEIAEKVVNHEFSAEIEAHRIKPVSIDPDMVVVSVVGANMRHIPGISGKLFQTLGKNGINVSAIAQGSSELNISAVVKKSQESKALNAIHDTFFLSGVTTVHLFQVGVGQVGAKLLSQIEQHSAQLTERGFSLKVVGLANSRSMVIDSDGLDLNSWQTSLEGGQASTPETFVKKAQELNLTNTVFVDCTANDSVADTYESLLESAISIVTPNKRANSSSYEQYLKLKALARKANVKFFYETNVGAGLPIIGTLNDLMLSGDRVIKIEAVLSGTLSYIFNTFVPGTSFSEVVKVAKEQGFTEPDPRDDLSGTDVARKLLILSRDMGIPLELEDVEVESLVPESCKDCASAEAFLEKLPESDSYFDEKLSAAANAGQVLRYIGIIENGKARVALEAVDNTHPFYSLSGSDNIISFITDRYLERPLVVKGPGAGTDVTAAGVLADIVRAASYLAF